MIDNFQKIESLLQFKNEGDFYFVQILRRRKDNPEMKTDMVLVNNYFIYSIEDYYDKKIRITNDCHTYNARAYIRLNVRNAEKIAMQTLKKVTDYILQKDFKAVKNAYLSACGEFHSQVPKRWIVDIDEKGGDLQGIMNYIYECEPVGQKIETIIETKNGYHLITTPFNLQTWRKLIKNPIDIHKDNPTILYIP